MAYSDFSLEDLATTFGVTTQEADLFPGITPLLVPGWLRDTLAKGTQLALLSEKSRSEFIVAPVLVACRDVSDGQLAIFSGQRLDVDVAAGLTGECDFILALAPPVPPLRAPIATILEAKRNDIELGLGQCIAQMLAARQFNSSAKQIAAPMFGCVTTGEAWQFLRLDGKIALLHARRFYMDDVGSILAAVQAIVLQAAAAKR